MNVLIVENEVYLARSIDTKLSSLGYKCHIASNLKEALNDDYYDAILLSTNISGQSFYPVIEKHKESIIILMISYISNDTVTHPIKAGANDYIQKPFMIEELIRKLEHLKKFSALQKENLNYKNYLDFLFKNISNINIEKRIKLPLLLKTNSQKTADAIMFKISKLLSKQFNIIALEGVENIKKIDLVPNSINYIINLQLIKKNDKIKIINSIKNQQVVLSSTDMDEDLPIQSIEISSNANMFELQNILSLEDYIKHIIQNHQNRFPDTELSKKLGISRKSLWEKRKKYGIEREK